MAEPDTGTNDIVASFDASQWNNISIFACSFTNSGGVGNIGTDEISATPHIQNLTVSENSIIYASCGSVAAISGIDIDSSSRTVEFTHNVNDQTIGALSATGLTAGSTEVKTTSTSGSITNYRVEILEASTPSGNSSGNFMMMF